MNWIHPCVLRLDLSEMSVLLGSKEGSNCELINTIVNMCKRHVYVSRYNGTNFK